jgi:hypothetical protein
MNAWIVSGSLTMGNSPAGATATPAAGAAAGAASEPPAGAWGAQAAIKIDSTANILHNPMRRRLNMNFLLDDSIYFFVA